jgi:hypothetical protein
VGGGVQLGPLGTVATNTPIVPARGDYDDGQIGGMMIGRGNGSTLRKPAPVPLCPPQTPHAVRTRTRAAAMGSQRLTAWATARPPDTLHSVVIGTYGVRAHCYHAIVWVLFRVTVRVCLRRTTVHGDSPGFLRDIQGSDLNMAFLSVCVLKLGTNPSILR